MLAVVRRFGFAVLALAILTSSANAHETDQYSLPQGREFADLGEYFTGIIYDTIAWGVDRQNAKIKAAIGADEHGKDLADLQSPDAIASSVNQAFPVALFFIDDLDKRNTDPAIRLQYPGRLVGFLNHDGVRRHVDIPLSPLNAWSAANIKVFGVYIGDDKIGHFSDMGMHYYRAYRNVVRKGGNEAEAMKAALHLGTEDPIFSERGLLGLATAGAYSNGDLTANYMGFRFYQNLTEPVRLKGQLRSPMLVREGAYWKIADFVKPDSDFFSWFICDQMNEALNPSWYRDDIRGRIRQAIVEFRQDVLVRYTDPNGNPWTPAQFAAKTNELKTYYGENYGHAGDKVLITIDRTCFAPPPDMSNIASRNADGLMPLHYAAMVDDVACVQQLINRGADVNGRVVSEVNAPAVDGDTPLHIAARAGDDQIVQLLLAHGARIQATNDHGDTALHVAVAHPAIEKLLIAAGANVNLPDVTGRTPLHFAARDPAANETLPLLLAAGANPRAADHAGQTALFDAVRGENAVAVSALLRAKADVNAKDQFGQTALHLAAADAASDVATVLLGGGAAVNAQDDFGCTPLFIATRLDHPQTVAALIHSGANPRIADAYGISALTLTQSARTDAVAVLNAARVSANSAEAAAARMGPDAHWTVDNATLHPLQSR